MERLKEEHELNGEGLLVELYGTYASQRPNWVTIGEWVNIDGQEAHVVPEITGDVDSTYEKTGVMDNGQADTEAVGMGRVSNRNRTEGIYNGYEPEHSMEPTNDNNTKNTCKVNRKWKRLRLKNYLRSMKRTSTNCSKEGSQNEE